MNKVASQRNGFSPDFEEEKTLNDENVWEIYDFHRLVKVRKFAENMNVVIINQIDHFIKKSKVHLKSVKKF